SRLIQRTVGSGSPVPGASRSRRSSGMRSAQPTHGARLEEGAGSETLAFGPELRPRTKALASGPAVATLEESLRYAHATPPREYTVVSAGLTPARAARTTSASESRL